MGFFDKLFGSKAPSGPGNQCPACGSMATVTGGKVFCSNPSCANYSASGKAAKVSGKSGRFSPQKPIEIHYRNFRNEEKVFPSDAATIERKRNHLSVQVAPSGERIALSRSRILNLPQIEASFPQRVAPDQSWPTPRERQVLNYHKKHGTTSPLYEKVRAKYPNW
jgi:hypothetical protein